MATTYKIILTIPEEKYEEIINRVLDGLDYCEVEKHEDKTITKHYSIVKAVDMDVDMEIIKQDPSNGDDNANT